MSLRAATAEEAKILDLEWEWCAAYLHGDAAALKKIEVEDFTLTNSSGKISTLADDLKQIADGTTKYSVFELRHESARLRRHAGPTQRRVAGRGRTCFKTAGKIMARLLSCLSQ